VVDFTANGGIRGEYPEIADYIEAALASFAVCQHYYSNYLFEVTGDVGGGRFYCSTQMVSLTQDGEQILADGGFYDVTFTRTDDGWRIKEMIAGLTWLDGIWPDGVPRPGWYGVSTDRY
jgi:SnoaL-like domain